MNFKNQVIRYVILMLLFLITSCETEKEIDYDAFYEGDKIVVHGFMNQKDGVNLIVKKTLPPDDINANDKLNDASVFLIKIDENIAFNKVDDYTYTLPSSLLDLTANYSIEIASSNLESVQSTNQNLVTATLIDSLKIETEGFHQNLKIYYNNLNIDTRYYSKIYEYFDGEIVDFSHYQAAMFDPYSMLVPLSIGAQQHTYKIYNDELDSIRVKLFTFSDDLALFCESYSDYEGTSQDPFIDYRLPVYSNIENGNGLFASYDYDEKTIVLE